MRARQSPSGVPRRKERYFENEWNKLAWDFCGYSNLVLIVIAIAAIVAMFVFVPPWSQNPAYHLFADQRAFVGVPNGQNVLSNVGFLLIGAWGAGYVLVRLSDPLLRVPYLVFFAGVFFTAFGSAWYHLNPSNATLVWDRLPMTMMFLGFFCAMLAEIVSPRHARLLLLPLLAVGVVSVVWWAWTETRGQGDLRVYGLVQFLPPVLLVPMIFMYPDARKTRTYIVCLILLFALAKWFEHYDSRVFEVTGFVVGGHALKHMFAAMATACPLLMLYRRQLSNQT